MRGSPATTEAPAAPASGTAPSDAGQASNVTASAPPAEGAAPKTDSKPGGSHPAGWAVLSQQSLLDVPLKFAYPINADTLRGEIEDAARAADLAMSYFELSNPEWEGGSNAFKDWTLRIAADEQQTETLLSQLSQRFSQTPVWPSSSKIGSQVADRMQNRALAALVISWLGIIIYIWIRFQHLTYGLAAVVALCTMCSSRWAPSRRAWVADYMGWLLIEEFKVNLTVVAALLTVIGYSVNDTIVVFDRIREVRGKSTHI